MIGLHKTTVKLFNCFVYSQVHYIEYKSVFFVHSFLLKQSYTAIKVEMKFIYICCPNKCKHCSLKLKYILGIK